MRHRTLVPTLHVSKENGQFDFANSPFYVNKETRAWEVPRATLRRAAVSSFGFSGTNAHLVVEEYAAPREDRGAGAVQEGRALIPLSARTQAVLRRKAEELLAWLEDREETVELASLAYTLQVGRAAMEERLGIVASSIAELRAKLRTYLADRTDDPDIHSGTVKEGGQLAGLSSARGRLSEVLAAWVDGRTVEWKERYEGRPPHRISLPGYPFAMHRCWFSTARPTRMEAAATAPRLHPLLHENTSTLRQHSYTTLFTGQEPYLRDHRLTVDGAGQALLPAVIYLEMARAAVEHATPSAERRPVLVLRDTVWLRRTVVTGNSRLQIALGINDAEAVAFTITSEGNDGRPVVHCQGEGAFVTGPVPSRLDLGRLRQQTRDSTMEADSLYSLFSRAGFEYGATHRSVVRLHRGTKQLLAELRLPPAVGEEYLLRPGIMDGALQAVIGVAEDMRRPPSRPLLFPFALKTLRVFSACPSEAYAWIRATRGIAATDTFAQMDIDLCDSEGNICVQMQGYSVRAGGGELLGRSPRSEFEEQPAGAPVHEETVFGDAFYSKLVEQVSRREISVDEAVGFG